MHNAHVGIIIHDCLDVRRHRRAQLGDVVRLAMGMSESQAACQSWTCSLLFSCPWETALVVRAARHRVLALSDYWIDITTLLGGGPPQGPGTAS